MRKGSVEVSKNFIVCNFHPILLYEYSGWLNLEDLDGNYMLINENAIEVSRQMTISRKVVFVMKKKIFEIYRLFIDK